MYITNPTQIMAIIPVKCKWWGLSSILKSCSFFSTWISHHCVYPNTGRKQISNNNAPLQGRDRSIIKFIIAYHNASKSFHLTFYLWFYNVSELKCENFSIGCLLGFLLYFKKLKVSNIYLLIFQRKLHYSTFSISAFFLLLWLITRCEVENQRNSLWVSQHHPPPPQKKKKKKLSSKEREEYQSLYFSKVFFFFIDIWISFK